MSSNRFHSNLWVARIGPRSVAILLWIAVGGANIALSFLSPLASPDILKLLATTAGGILLSLGLTLLTEETIRRRNRLVWPLLATFVFLSGSLLWVVDTAVQYWSVHGVASFSIAELAPYRYNWVYFVAIFSLQTVVLALLMSNRTIEARERQLAEARLTAQQARFAALQFQLNPHFLFNTLSAISTMAADAGAYEADGMITRLSDFLRASLASEPGMLITLESELDTVQAYLEIEAVRFGNRLDINYVCAAGLADALVPPLILQPLVENAVKYAVSRSSKLVKINIEARAMQNRLTLIVEDNGHATDTTGHNHGTGVGLKNVAGRLEALFGSEGQLEVIQRESGFIAMLRIPLTRADEPAQKP